MKMKFRMARNRAVGRPGTMLFVALASLWAGAALGATTKIIVIPSITAGPVPSIIRAGDPASAAIAGLRADAYGLPRIDPEDPVQPQWWWTCEPGMVRYEDDDIGRVVGYAYSKPLQSTPTWAMASAGYHVTLTSPAGIARLDPPKTLPSPNSVATMIAWFDTPVYWRIRVTAHIDYKDNMGNEWYGIGSMYVYITAVKVDILWEGVDPLKDTSGGTSNVNSVITNRTDYMVVGLQVKMRGVYQPSDLHSENHNWGIPGAQTTPQAVVGGFTITASAADVYPPDRAHTQGNPATTVAPLL